MIPLCNCTMECDLILELSYAAPERQIGAKNRMVGKATEILETVSFTKN